MSGYVKPTAAQKARMGAVKRSGCRACEQNLRLNLSTTGQAVECHHVTKTKRVGHDATFGLCVFHHRGHEARRSTPFAAPLRKVKAEHFDSVAHNILAAARLSSSAIAVFYADSGVKTLYVNQHPSKADALIARLPGAYVGTYTADARAEDVAEDIAWVADGGYVRR